MKAADFNKKENNHKLSVEEKMKFKVKEFGGIQCEAKWKNNGELSYEYESDALKVSFIIKSY